MTRKTICLLAILAILLAVPVYANSRTISVNPDIAFSNNTATCTVDIRANGLTDSISATMELWQGTTKIDEWSGSGTYYLSMEETASVKRYKTYRLIINYSINNITRPSVTIDRYYS